MRIPVMEMTRRFSAADDGLAIWAQDERLDGADIVNVLVHSDTSSRENGQVYVALTGMTDTVEVTTHYFTNPPPLLDVEWEDVVEFSLVAGAPLSITELVDLRPMPLTPDAGAFRVRVAGAGRTPRGREKYLIQAWPAEQSPVVVTRMNSTFAASMQAREQIEQQAVPARLAAGRIGADLDEQTGARQLSGATGTLTVRRTIAARRRKLFGYLLRELPNWGGMGGPLPDTVEATFYNRPPIDGSQPLCGEVGMVKRVRIEEVSPRLRVQTFVWLRPEAGVMLIDSTRQFPVGGTLLTTTWDEQRDPEGLVSTTITVTHSDLPIEWLDDMGTWWSLQLAWIDWHARFRK